MGGGREVQPIDRSQESVDVIFLDSSTMRRSDQIKASVFDGSEFHASWRLERIETVRDHGKEELQQAIKRDLTLNGTWKIA
ncbi:hypothetical protein AAES_124428 [Amazona aestiva]|uniref:Uncharacterized protein n=1 Tax=Amazona aestiva TaxID=12930 RepID=A0A0Q3R2Z5_AMAAE|nr:hypothetical protein AAES_124428 [Amazona aestiva]